MGFNFDVTFTMLPITPGIYWEGSLEEDENYWDAALQLDYNLEVGSIALAYQGEGDETGCNLVPWELEWMVATAYAITSWTVVYPFGALHEARFTF